MPSASSTNGAGSGTFEERGELQVGGRQSLRLRACQAPERLVDPHLDPDLGEVRPDDLGDALVHGITAEVEGCLTDGSRAGEPACRGEVRLVGVGDVAARPADGSGDEAVGRLLAEDPCKRAPIERVGGCATHADVMEERSMRVERDPVDPRLPGRQVARVAGATGSARQAVSGVERAAGSERAGPVVADGACRHIVGAPLLDARDGVRRLDVRSCRRCARSGEAGHLCSWGSGPARPGRRSPRRPGTGPPSGSASTCRRRARPACRSARGRRRTRRAVPGGRPRRASGGS